MEREQRLLSAEEAFVNTSAAIPLFSLSRVMVVSSGECYENVSADDSDFFGMIEYYPASDNCP
jgi:hypothetical protein